MRLIGRINTKARVSLIILVEIADLFLRYRHLSLLTLNRMFTIPQLHSLLYFVEVLMIVIVRFDVLLLPKHLIYGIRVKDLLCDQYEEVRYQADNWASNDHEPEVRATKHLPDHTKDLRLNNVGNDRSLAYK